MPSRKERKLVRLQSHRLKGAAEDHGSEHEDQPNVGFLRCPKSPFNADLSKANIFSIFQSPPFRIYLVNTDRTFYVNAAPLRAGSEYFKALLTSTCMWKEQHEYRIELDLPTLLEDSFGMAIEFLYTTTYEPQLLADTYNPYMVHLGTYLLADRLMIWTLKAFALRRMKDTLHSGHAFRGLISATDIAAMVDMAYSDAVADGSDEIALNRVHTNVTRDEGSGLTAVPQSSDEPSNEPTDEPTDSPSDEPFDKPSDGPTDEPTDEPSEEPPNEPSDPRRDMQLVIASHVASHLTSFKQHQCIKDRFRQGGDFVLDVFELLDVNGQGFWQ